MKIYDITGRIAKGIWSYGPPFPDFEMRPLPQPEWVENRVWCDIFDGMNSQTGTYLETPAHVLGPEASYNLEDVDVARLVDIPAVLLELDPGMHVPGKRAKVTAEVTTVLAEMVPRLRMTPSERSGSRPLTKRAVTVGAGSADVTSDQTRFALLVLTFSSAELSLLSEIFPSTKRTWSTAALAVTSASVSLRLYTRMA